MASPSSIKPFLKKFLTDNFKPLFSSNELGALGNIATEKQIMDEFGALPKIEITGEDIRSTFADKYRLYNDNLEAYNIEVDSGGYSKYKKREPIVFSDSQLSALDPNKALELNLNNISDLSESQLGRIKLEDLNADQLIEYENRMKELGLL